jgi:hypothetical protein
VVKKRNTSPFRGLQGAAVGMTGIGLSTAVGAGIASHAPAGTPSMTQGFNTMAGFMPVAVTAVA